ncbi:MAG: bifunctional precorrin-2 dehydrogenase/sirohydrochlorin ferrochelatase [Oscillospiraceae bacterium]|nr:bifunctional precorrin-2 dehydrogenase/sirohydrochlorin ferrochelatase [Oscillospiraceae bacterium]MDY6207534.1 bifunctional precorrin-2 dehydrogenase/sirohydrochlorin ferrochelatase [Oscillospiraceae bacterium]
MGYFPFFKDIKDKLIAVIGGGKVACRKVRILAAHGAMITVTAPDVCDEIYKLAAKCDNIKINVKPFSDDDLDDVFAVISATSDNGVNLHIYELCREKNIPVNTVDDPEKCTFIFPALVHKGNISVGISSSGTAPAFSAYLRRKIGELIDDKMLFCAEMTAEIRPLVKEKFSSEEQRRNAVYAVINYIDGAEKIPDRSEIYKLLEDIEK